LKYFDLKSFAVRHLGLIFISSVILVTSKAGLTRHIKLHLNEKITLVLVWKVVRQFFISISYWSYDFGLRITNRSVDKIIAWPCLWCHMHICQNPRLRKARWFVIFSVQISQDIIKLRKIGKRDLHIILKVLPNEIKNIYILPYPFIKTTMLLNLYRILFRW
jgi:hypothetical protein